MNWVKAGIGGMVAVLGPALAGALLSVAAYSMTQERLSHDVTLSDRTHGHVETT